MKENKEIIKDFIKYVWNQKKVELISNYISNSYIAYTLGKGGEVKGIAEVKANVLNCHSKYKNFKINIKKIVQEGNIVSSWIFLSDGDKIMNELVIHRLSNGKIAEAWSIGGDWLTK